MCRRWWCLAHNSVSPPPSPCCKTTSSSQLRGLSVVMHSRPHPPHATLPVSTRRGSSETSPFQRLCIVALPLPDNINSAGTSTEIEEHLKRTGETVSAVLRPESCGGSHERLWRVWRPPLHHDCVSQERVDVACSLRYLLRRSPLSSSFVTRIVGVRAQAIISSRRGGSAASPTHAACPLLTLVVTDYQGTAERAAAQGRIRHLQAHPRPTT